MVTVLLELNHSNNYDECSIRVYRSLIIFHFLFMLALCLMLLATYYAQNYAGIISWSLKILQLPHHMRRHLQLKLTAKLGHSMQALRRRSTFSWPRQNLQNIT